MASDVVRALVKTEGARQVARPWGEETTVEAVSDGTVFRLAALSRNLADTGLP